MKPILTTPNTILIESAKPVKHFDKKLAEVISEMKETLLSTTDPEGVGLAAPQVGVQLRLFLAKPYRRSKIKVFINPDIKEVKPGMENLPAARLPAAQGSKRRKLLEGCLSVPNIWGRVERKGEVNIIYQDEKGKQHQQILKGFMATIAQHEFEHLNGILFTKHVIEQNGKLFRSFKNEEGKDEFEEIKV